MGWPYAWPCFICWREEEQKRTNFNAIFMQRIALFPGTFDPITIGHLDIINRSLPLFDKLYIGIGRNANKVPMFSEEQRLTWIKQIFKDNPKVDAVVYE